ncbi:hypothetical protein HYC85_031222 [Camellia sinensis]|uniref:Major facilitator superfamily (MFS) profile domain-containing protein n=1 Tax=Camellia sinensis TaxID=4442 RepID=A0A7J7FQB7_CAMSI|nr:hypothetical protein HYC85_031222 [Camellia sinensis]
MDNRQEVEQGENSLQEEIREPLIPEDKTRADEEDGYGAKDQSHKSSTMEHEWMVYLSTFAAVCGSYAFGTCAGYSSPTQSAIMDDLDLSLAEYSLFGSISTFGAMIGAITSGPIADFIGRKWAMRVSSGFCVAGWLAIYFAEGALVLDIGRLATGYAMGVFSYVVPVFITEIAPKSLRGALTTLNQVMIVAGVSVSLHNWNSADMENFSINRANSMCHSAIGSLFDSRVSQMAKIGRQKDFEAALQRLRGKDADISEEAAEIQIAVGLMVCQQLGGLSGISFYVASIFDTAGFPSSTGTIIYACIQVPIAALGATLIDKAGRKPLLLVSGSGMVIGCALTAISFYLEDHEIAVNASPILAVTGILVYIGAFSVGMGAVPWVIMSEIFPINVKGVGGSLATLVNWFIAWLVSYTFNYLMTWSSYGTFILYGAINLLAILFIVMVIGKMGNRQEVQQGENSLQEEIREPLIPEDKTRAGEEDGYGAKDQSHKSSTMEHEWMVYLSTFVAVCGSYAFGTCAGYSSPTQSAITDDLDLSLAEYSLFGSILTLGAMIGAITSGPIADFIGRKWVPVFIAEIAPKSLRGALTTLNQAKIGHQTDFEAALQRLRGKDADISEEAAEIQIGVGLMVCQQLGGINGICFYVASIFDTAGFPSSTGTIIYACIQVSGSGLVIGCALTAISFYLEVHEIAVNASPILAVTGILVYIGAFSVGMGAVPWVIMSEIFPINVKGVGGSLATLVNWFIAWLVSYTFNYLMAWSSYGTFILYGAINLLAILFIVMVVPETKGRTLEHIINGNHKAIIGYSSPTQSAITDNLDLSLAEYSLFGSILTFGAMIGAITSGPIADFIGRKWAKIGHQKDFEAALQRLRGKDADISEEAAEIQKPFNGSPRPNCWIYWSWTDVFSIQQVPITALGATLIDKAGRKPLLLVSGSGLVIGCALTAISFYLKVHEIAVDASPILAVTGILIFPINVKGVGGSLATLVNWFIAWLVSYTFNYLMTWSSCGTFILYGAINILAILFIVIVVPETKGRSLEQIQAAINV